MIDYNSLIHCDIGGPQTSLLLSRLCYSLLGAQPCQLHRMPLHPAALALAACSLLLLSVLPLAAAATGVGARTNTSPYKVDVVLYGEALCPYW